MLTHDLLHAERTWLMVPDWDLHTTLYAPAPASPSAAPNAPRPHAVRFFPSRSEADQDDASTLPLPPASSDDPESTGYADGGDRDALFWTAPSVLPDPPPGSLPPWASSAAQRATLQRTCMAYSSADSAASELRRPIVSGYPLGVLNGRLRAVSGRLWGASHAFVVRDAVVVLDGVVLTEDRIFTFERTCFAGSFCILDALTTLGTLSTPLPLLSLALPVALFLSADRNPCSLPAANYRFGFIACGTESCSAGRRCAAPASPAVSGGSGLRLV